jgi:hypothetical protein
MERVRVPWTSNCGWNKDKMNAQMRRAIESVQLLAKERAIRWPTTEL